MEHLLTFLMLKGIEILFIIVLVTIFVGLFKIAERFGKDDAIGIALGVLIILVLLGANWYMAGNIIKEQKLTPEKSKIQILLEDFKK